MKNIWTQHLERSNIEDSDKGTRFTKMLHSLARTNTTSDDSRATKLFFSENSASSDPSYSIRHDMDITPVKEDKINGLNNGVTKTSYVAETELNVWAAKSQKGHEIGLKSLSQDHVRLLMAEDGRLFLRYDVAGESSFEMTVKSENEAMQIIEEDNATTEQLYPQNPELKWIKIPLL